MASKIIFGSDLIDVLENKYNMNKLGEVPTKYKNGITIIDFIYGKEKDIDDLKYNKPYVEFSIDDETDGFISGTMYLNGVESVQFDSWEDLKYFMKNAKWTESEKYTRKSIKENLTRYDMIGQGFFVLISDISFGLCEQLGNKTQDTHWIRSFDTEKQAINFANKKGYPIVYEKFNESKKSARKSLKEGIDVKIVYADDTPSEYIDDVTHNDILDIIEESPEVYKIFDVSGSKKKLVWSDEYGFERAYESKKSARKSMKEGINDELIATSSDGETTLYLSDERQANHGKDPHYEFKLGENGYFTRYIRCDDNRCENIVLDWIKEFDLDISKSEISKIIKLHESKKSMKKSLKESVDGYIATDEDCNMSGKGWVLNGSYNFIMEFLQEWGIAPKDVKVKNGMTTLYNADSKPFGYVYQDEEVDIFVADKTTNWTWENHNPSTKRVKVTALDEIF